MLGRNPRCTMAVMMLPDSQEEREKSDASEMTRSWKIEPKLVHPRKELHSLLSVRSCR
jgi:hypothetical protein